MKRKRKIESPRWTRQQFVWYCHGCRAVKAGKVKVLRVKYRHYLCEPCGTKYMKDVRIVPESSLINRRYAWTNKSRKNWKCNRCGQLVEKGHHIEHSYSMDRKDCFALCLPCALDLEKV